MQDNNRENIKDNIKENIKENVIGTRLLKGQGLGNQLFCYVSVRCLAKEKGYGFSILGRETLANNIHSDCGLYFMDLDFGEPLSWSDFDSVIEERDDRIFLPNSLHDIEHGVYVTGPDTRLKELKGRVLIEGNLQAEKYFGKYRDEIKQWLKVKPEYDCMDYCRDDLCIIHIRCTDYTDSPELYLQKKYWMDGMARMREIRNDMKFMIITNDVRETGKLIPGVEAHNFDLAKDYSIIKNARYLLLANSSFTFFPAYCSDTVRYIIAPKYWARHNVSDGYWASEQNIYSIFHYMDRKGNVFDADKCRSELEAYKETSEVYRTLNLPIAEKYKKWAIRKARNIYRLHRARKIAAGIGRRIGLKV